MQGSGCSMVSPIIQPVHRVGSVVPAPSPALRERAGVRADANGESKWGQIKIHSKWGQIKIHEDPQFGARNALTKFCSDPFCAVFGARDPHHAQRQPRGPLATRACEWAAWKTTWEYTYSLNSSTPSKQASGVHGETPIFCRAVRFGALRSLWRLAHRPKSREFTAWSAAIFRSLYACSPLR